MSQDASSVPADVERLLRRRIKSVTQLESLLLLRSGPTTAVGVAGQLRISAEHAATELELLVKSGLARVEGDRYRYAPRGPKLSATVERLAAMYPSFRVAITAAIYAQPNRSMQSFADAFRIMTNDDGEDED